MYDFIKIDKSDLALQVCEEISKRCGHKIEITEPYIDPVDKEPIYRRSIYVNGEPADVSHQPLLGDPQSPSFYDAFIYSIAEQIKNSYGEAK